MNYALSHLIRMGIDLLRSLREFPSEDLHILSARTRKRHFLRRQRAVVSSRSSRREPAGKVNPGTNPAPDDVSDVARRAHGTTPSTPATVNATVPPVLRLVNNANSGGRRIDRSGWLGYMSF
jgi:hypothetical protein